MQVLIIDNDIAYRNGVSMAASNKHWIPVSCGDIRTAKQIISSTLPDLIISDCLLYGETVIDLLVWMKLQRIDTTSGGFELSRPPLSFVRRRIGGPRREPPC